MSQFIFSCFSGSGKSRRFTGLYFIPLFFCWSFCLSLVSAQINQKGTPVTFSRNLPLPEATEVIQPDWNQVYEEDKTAPHETYRVAVALKTGFTLQNAGAWTELGNGDRIWRLRLKSEKAKEIAIAYDHFHLPPGARLFVFSLDRKNVLGAYTAANNSKEAEFLSGPLKGEECVIEYFEPASVKGLGRFDIPFIYHHYRGGAQSANQTDDTGFNGALTCELNVNCPQGANWQTQKRSVVRIYMAMKNAAFWCSGSIMANTSKDGTPYVLSAYHCQDGYIPNYNRWTFYFNYESADCSNPATEPALTSLQGCHFDAGRQGSDFLLVTLTNQIPSDYNPFYAGWNRDTSVLPSSTTMIHHPQGDIKKISLSNSAPIVLPNSTFWSNNVTTPAYTHIQTTLTQGTSEDGSSGSPLFDQNARIIAQLHGGINSTDGCTNNYVIYGRLAVSWDGDQASTRLKDWLDPANSGASTFDGSNGPIRASVSGHIKTYNGTPVPNAQVTLDSIYTATTDADGLFSFGGLTLNVSHNFSLTKNTSPSNGVDAVDLLQTRRYILHIQSFDNPYSLIAADVNLSGSVTTFDITLMQKVILGFIDHFPAPSWQFVPASYVFADPAKPFDLPSLTNFDISFTGNINNLDFIAVKTGDVNHTADPGQ